MSLIIYYGIKNEERKARLIKAAREQDIALREVAQDEVGEYVGYLAGLESYEKIGGAEDAPEDELLVFVDLHSHDLQHILVSLRDMGEVFPHKAALTETNKDWTFARLIKHIRRENAIVQEWSKMLAVAKECMEKQKTHPTDTRAEALAFAKDLRLKGEAMEEADVKEAIRRLEESL